MNLVDKRILVTGGNGFLGKHVLSKLQGLDVWAPRKSEYDLTRQDAVKDLMDKVGPDIIIHLAATVGGIGANMENPGRFFYDNAIMGINLIEQARLSGVEKFVTLGTVCMYPKNTPVPFYEDNLWEGYPEETNAPYGLAKKMLMVQGQAYRQQYGMNIITLIPVNLYGPGDHFDPSISHVIPALINKFVAAKESGAHSVEVWGTGNASREFLYVEDAAEGIVKGTKSWDYPAPVNLGSGKEITIKNLAGIISQCVGYEGEIVWNTSKPDGQPRRCLDVSRAEAFGFTAKTPFSEGLKKTVDWYLANRGVK